MNRQELTKDYFTFRDEKDKLNKRLKEVQEELDTLEDRLVNTMINENLTSFADVTNGTVYLREEVYASIEDHEKCFQWFREKGIGDAIKESIHAKTLAAIAKDNNLEVPGVKTYLKTKIGIRRS